jgi:hypothetical protein
LTQQYDFHEGTHVLRVGVQEQSYRNKEIW